MYNHVTTEEKKNRFKVTVKNYFNAVQEQLCMILGMNWMQYEGDTRETRKPGTLR